MISQKHRVIPVVVMLCMTSPAMSDIAVPDGVERYSRDLDGVVKGVGRVSLEPLFEEGRRAGTALVRDRQLERLDDLTYRKVQELLKGFVVRREEIVLVEPRADFFLRLARDKGTKTDEAFFEALQKTYPDGIWPAYKQALTDDTACIVFDKGILSELYGVWRGFQQSYPEQYPTETNRELTRIEDAVGSTCACGGRESAVRDLSSFVAEYPDTRVAGSVLSRLASLKKGGSDMVFYCKPK